jgi:release factor glutamine methyltransferase
MEIWTVSKVLSWAASDFKARGIARPRFEAEVLLAHALGCERIDLYTGFDRPLDKEEMRACREAITRRRRWEPSAYILGKKEFWSLKFEIDSNVLVPRPETEALVEAALARASTGPILDLCTGSGCVAVAMAHERPDLKIDAQDISPQALAVAGKNVARHGVEAQVRIFEGDLFESLPGDAKYEVITANPPYISDRDMEDLPREVAREPRIALAGGPDGLNVINRIIRGAPGFLLPGGWLIMEVDYRQAGELAQKTGPSVLGAPGEVIRDLAGKERVIAWRVKGCL